MIATIHVVSSCETNDVPTIRRIGANAIEGEVLAFLEDSCVARSGWNDAIRKAFEDPAVMAVSGPVIQGSPRAIDWAVYFAEYAPFAAQSSRLAGPNFAVRRSLLVGAEPIREHAISCPVTWVPEAAVTHVRHYDFKTALADRYRFGHEFGRIRWDGNIKPWTRLGIWAAPAIFALQLGRLLKAITAHPPLILPCLRNLPLTFLMLLSWSAGEAQGWADAWRLYEKAGRSRTSTRVPARSSRSDYKPAQELA